MPVYNCEEYLAQSIGSVIEQTMADWELICINDASSDNSLNILNTYSHSDPRIKVISLAVNEGAACARNRGIDAARGDYIAFLDADDWWEARKLATQLRVIRESAAQLVCTGYDAIAAAGEVRFSTIPPERITFDDLLKTSKIGCSTVLLDKRSLGSTRMPLIRKRQDYAFWLLLAQKGLKIQGISEILTHYRVRPGSLSHQKSTVLGYQWRVYREILRLSWPRSLRCFISYAIHGVLRRVFPMLKF